MVDWAEKVGELSFVSSDAALAMIEESALLAKQAHGSDHP
jgi:hypothetical protein